jgi:hypothetical protein
VKYRWIWTILINGHKNGSLSLISLQVFSNKKYPPLYINGRQLVESDFDNFLDKIEMEKSSNHSNNIELIKCKVE